MKTLHWLKGQLIDLLQMGGLGLQAVVLLRWIIEGDASSVAFGAKYSMIGLTAYLVGHNWDRPDVTWISRLKSVGIYMAFMSVPIAILANHALWFIGLVIGGVLTAICGAIFGSTPEPQETREKQK
ncbi:MAG TPA: hypothetical protein VM581_02625 [Magnetospirillaceae bacterium]|nr:hypothetical protein [Magnetospirillaceae bacterium]